MNLTPDHTLIYQVILFIFVWIGLSRMAFAPTSEVLDKRRGRTVAAEEEAVSMVASADSDRETYDRKVHERRAQLSAETASARASAQEESAQVLNSARESANQALNAQRAAVAGQIESARKTLANDVDAIANQMLTRVSGGKA